MFWFYVNPLFGITARARDLRLGRGKGRIFKKVAIVKQGARILEILELSEMVAKKILLCCSKKLSIECSIIYLNL